MSNIERMSEMVLSVDVPTDIFVLPEMWTGECDIEASRAALGAVRGICARRGVYAVAGTVPWPVDGGVANRSWVVNDAGEVFAFYDKTHLFSYGGEHERFKAGNVPLIFDVGGVACSIATCYELRFSEYTRSLGLAGASVIFSPSQWAKTRRSAWDLLVRSTAATSQTYVVACNAAEASHDPINFGHSLIASPWGDSLASLDGGEGMFSLALDLGQVEKYRRRVPLERDRRPELYGLLVS